MKLQIFVAANCQGSIIAKMSCKRCKGEILVINNFTVSWMHLKLWDNFVTHFQERWLIHSLSCKKTFKLECLTFPFFGKVCMIISSFRIGCESNYIWKIAEQNCSFTVGIAGGCYNFGLSTSYSCFWSFWNFREPFLSYFFTLENFEIIFKIRIHTFGSSL